MDVVLPKEIAYLPSLNSLPECNSIEVCLTATNGNSFTAGQLIQFDLPNKGFLDPQSLYIRYNYTIAGGTGNAIIRGTPVYSFFQKLETIIGSSVVESINDYNQVCNMWTNLQMDVAMKYGNATAYGWLNNELTFGAFDGRTCTSNAETNSLAAPLPCMISLAEKMIPLQFLQNVRIQLTTESISSMFFAGTTIPTSYTLRNVELCFNLIDFTGPVYNIVQNMGDRFYIKSSSFQSMSQYIPVGSSGSTDLLFNCRLASIKSLFCHFCDGSAARSVNGKFESVDITNAKGEYSFNIAGVSYPSRVISTQNCKSSVLMELRKAVGALHKDSYNFSINADEFSVTDYSLSQAATTQGQSAKFWLGVNCEKLSSGGVLLSGVSSQQSPISLRVLIPTALTGGYNVTLNVLYDCLIEVDARNRMCNVKQ